MKLGVVESCITCFSMALPIGSMYGIFPYIYHQYQPNVGNYTIITWILYGIVGCLLPTWVGPFYTLNAPSLFEKGKHSYERTAKPAKDHTNEQIFAAENEAEEGHNLQKQTAQSVRLTHNVTREREFNSRMKTSGCILCRSTLWSCSSWHKFHTSTRLSATSAKEVSFTIPYGRLQKKTWWILGNKNSTQAWRSQYMTVLDWLIRVLIDRDWSTMTSTSHSDFGKHFPGDFGSRPAISAKDLVLQAALLAVCVFCWLCVFFHTPRNKKLVAPKTNDV